MSTIYERRSTKNLEEAIESLKSNLKNERFGVLWELNFKETLAKKELKLNDDFIIFEVCDPKQAQNILNENIYAGYTLPCKMAIRVEENATYIGLLSPVNMMSGFNNPKLDLIAKSVEETLKKVIEESI